jgi:oxygen-independent coproporphyrinogen-3 oxidase
MRCRAATRWSAILTACIFAIGTCFGHLSGVHYQNKTHWDDYLAAVDADELPLHRGLAPSQRELLIRELVLGLKRGRIDTSRLAKKFGVDPLSEWASVWQALTDEGYLEPLGRQSQPQLTRRGLLEVDRLLHRFFDA